MAGLISSEMDMWPALGSRVQRFKTSSPAAFRVLLMLPEELMELSCLLFLEHELNGMEHHSGSHLLRQKVRSVPSRGRREKIPERKQRLDIAWANPEASSLGFLLSDPEMTGGGLCLIFLLTSQGVLTNRKSLRVSRT
jgi:hypothetical protein